MHCALLRWRAGRSDGMYAARAAVSAVSALAGAVEKQATARDAAGRLRPGKDSTSGRTVQGVWITFQVVPTLLPTLWRILGYRLLHSFHPSRLPMPRAFVVVLAVATLLFCARRADGQAAQPAADTVFIRLNLVGYLSEDAKEAVAFARVPVAGAFSVVEETTGRVAFSGQARQQRRSDWGGRYPHHALLDFSGVAAPGRYHLRFEPTGNVSPSFSIGRERLGRPQESLLLFLRQQRCGYNPYLDRVCHRRDGRTFYGPMPDSTFIDLSGGWHDAGDQLKYLITGSNATARLLLAYSLLPSRFGDGVNALGQQGPNGLPDVLDEARWGLDWLEKMHPAPTWLFHQVADDRDHIGWKWPDRDSSDYGWGPNSYRAAYFATGTPQGLREHKSEATGVANLAGRTAAAFALAAHVWREEVGDTVQAAVYLHKARTAYALGRANEGFQQGNSYGAPYRYNESTWADDMEWGAAELYRVTGERQYLAEAKHYARQAATTSWMPLDSADHYRYYPFVNVGHFALYPHVDAAFQDTLAGYYRAGIEATLRRGQGNPYTIGVPFIWCSNNLVVALATQIALYERMTGDTRYHAFLLAQRDWLLGRNPWGSSMFTGIPEAGEYPLDVHTSVWALTREMVPGGLVDGPVYATIYNSLKGLRLNEADEFAAFQTDFVVYHDDIGDYSTNEPTMDGTAGAVLLMALFGADAPAPSR